MDTGAKKSGKLYGKPDIMRTGPKPNGDGPIGRKMSASFETGTKLSKEDGKIGHKVSANLSSGTKRDQKNEDSDGMA